ncbi:lysyl oxidase family protein [Natrinema sp. 1APR25-10V2]|uniref:lysyl oxidase family protein n=1 Tax=Natrinema sp. 1APR25-10V2 TaxID=2951081 RepID=UPI002876EFF1|nr:lysyl oxidase family protein [Natrinema sp. 1APR25-10V2]MDS0477947.1 lysyl oxidase family protein [Natrinema sp. 1APR25-10V2]
MFGSQILSESERRCFSVVDDFERVHEVYDQSVGFLLFFFSFWSSADREEKMKGNYIRDRKRAAVVAGILLIAVAGVATITLAGVAVDSPFTTSVSDSSTDPATASGSEDTADEGGTPADEANSTAPPSTPTESDPESADDQAEDGQTEDDSVGEDRAETRSGVNFVPGVREFTISTEVFDESSADVEDGFVTPGEHRLLRFDMIIYNAGNRDAELGNPMNRPDLYEYSDSHSHAHLKGFNKYALFNESGEKMGVGKKQTFCLRDNFRMPSRPNANSSAQFDCDYQGISAGWADVYDSSLPGQYLVIDALPDGTYTLRATTNAEGTIDETCTGDNTVRVDLRIDDGEVTVTNASQSRPIRPSPC